MPVGLPIRADAADAAKKAVAGEQGKSESGV